MKKNKRIDIQIEIDEDKNVFSNISKDSIAETIKLALLLKGINYDEFNITEYQREWIEIK